jgi:hypothetical protein
MTTVVFDTFAYMATGAPTARTTPARIADIVNAKEFGAVGDGVADDRAALQAAIDAAFGPASSPHGGLGPGYPLNRELFIPNGTYNISAPLILTSVRGPKIRGAGRMATRIVNTVTDTSAGPQYFGTVFHTAGFDYAVVKNMTLAAAAPAPASITASISNTTLTVSAVSSGIVAVGKAIDYIAGIGLDPSNPNVIIALGTGTGGVGTYTISAPSPQTVSSHALTLSSANRGFDLAWDGSGTVALHAITFENIRFEGGDHGCGIGNGGQMGSEVLFKGCDFIGCAAGMAGFNQNALDMTVMGGSFQNCDIGINCHGASTFSYVVGVNFSGSTSQDILFNSFDGMVVEGCRSTSQMFLKLIGSVPMHTKACQHAPAGAVGQYAVCQAFLIMDGCLVTNAVLQKAPDAQDGNALYMRGCSLPGTFISGSTKVPTIPENI